MRKHAHINWVNCLHYDGENWVEDAPTSTAHLTFPYLSLHVNYNQNSKWDYQIFTDLDDKYRRGSCERIGSFDTKEQAKNAALKEAVKIMEGEMRLWHDLKYQATLDSNPQYKAIQEQETKRKTKKALHKIAK